MIAAGVRAGDAREERRRRVGIFLPLATRAVDELEREAAAGRRPRTDYVELARVLDAEVIDASYMATRSTPVARAAGRRWGVLASMPVEAFLRRRNFRRMLVWSEPVGLLVATLLKLARSRRDLVMLAILISTQKRAFFFTRLKVHSHIGAIVCYGTAQLEIAATEFGVPREKLHLALQPVDDRFWRPTGARPESVVASVGWAERDYETLFEAIAGLDLTVEIAVGSTGPAPLRSEIEALAARVPPNVSIRRDLDPVALRELYSRSRFVVVPLRDVAWDAGVTSIVEAMAMGRAVIVSRTRGQVDVLEDGKQGIYVPPNDPKALRSAVQYLAESPEEAERMGRAGRRRVEENHALDKYVARLAAIIEGVKVHTTAPAV